MKTPDSVVPLLYVADPESSQVSLDEMQAGVLCGAVNTLLSFDSFCGGMLKSEHRTELFQLYAELHEKMGAQRLTLTEKGMFYAHYALMFAAGVTFVPVEQINGATVAQEIRSTVAETTRSNVIFLIQHLHPMVDEVQKCWFQDEANSARRLLQKYQI